MKPARRIPASEQLAIWRRYRENGDLRERDRLVFMMMPMVAAVVRRKIGEVPAHVDMEDFLSVGVEALIRSIERYDPDKGATLEQYAWTRIQGAVLDELRALDWAPRSLRREERAIQAARDAFTVANDRRPSSEELAEAAGMSAGELRECLQRAAVANVGSLNTLVAGEDGSGVEQLEMIETSDTSTDPELHALRSAAKERFRSAFAGLSDQEREIAVLIHGRNWTLREIGAKLNLSESRISQIHSQMRRRMADRLAEDSSLFLEVF